MKNNNQQENNTDLPTSYRQVHVDLSSARKQVYVKNSILDFLHEKMMDGESLNRPNQNKESINHFNNLISKIQFYSVDIPSHLFYDKIFLSADLMTKRPHTQSLVYSQFRKLEGIESKLTHIDMENKKLLIEKTETMLISEEIIKTENLKNNEFLLYMHSREMYSNNTELLNEFYSSYKDNSEDLDALYQILKHSGAVFFLIEKNEDSNFSIKGHYTDEASVFKKGLYFIGKEYTEQLIEEHV